MKKILLSLLSIAAVGTVAFGATTAFFSDVETSTGNTFTAGELDLKVDNECHYWTDENADSLYVDVGCPGGSTWSLTDLETGVHKFFNFDDIKPGDYGEDTVSLHVYDNDAWGRLIIDRLANDDNGLTEPEDDVDATGGVGEGELGQNLIFWVWLDQGAVPGFQCPENEPRCEVDRLEGDNILQEPYELPLISPGTVEDGETWYLADGLLAAYGAYGCAVTPCPGLEPDGHMVGSITYYFGIGWELPPDVGNIVQSDSLSGDMTIEVEQYRNNPTPWP